MTLSLSGRATRSGWRCYNARQRRIETEERMPNDAALRKHLLALLNGGQAHATFDDTVRGFPLDKLGVRPAGLPHSGWELLEHLRIAQNDILRFSRSADYVGMKWP